ncbi:hypothetical protein MMC21_005922 [Puttea exsequens]|nr:hypothetical protein [Puttea exsequens]
MGNSNPFKSGVSPPSLTHSLTLSASSNEDMALSPVSSRSSTSSSSSGLSLSPDDVSPKTPPSSLSSESFASCSHPSWPKRTILTPLSSFCGSQASSYISDEDLLALDERELRAAADGVRVIDEEPEISWEATRQAPLVLQTLTFAQKRAAPRAQKRGRKSQVLKRSKMQSGLSPVLEAPD